MKYVITIIVLNVFCAVFAQVKNSGIEIRPKFGFLAAHRGTMAHIPQNHAFAGELTWYTQGNGSRKWHHAYKNPYYGATFYYGSAGNKEILGNYIGMYGFIEFPFVKKRWYTFSGKLSAGLGYTSHIYDPVLNPKNSAIGSRLNALICLAVKQQFEIGKRDYLSLNIDMTHFSNGASKVPNLGLNLPYLSIGYGHHFFKQNWKSDTVLVDHLPKNWVFGVLGIISFKEVYPVGGKKHMIYALNFHTKKYFRPKVGLEMGLDVVSKQAILYYKPELEKNQWDVVQMGVYAAYLLPLDNFQFVLGMGAYFKDKFQPESTFYHRIGMRYYFKGGWHANLVLKSNFAKADYVEYGIGYTFKYQKK